MAVSKKAKYGHTAQGPVLTNTTPKRRTMIIKLLSTAGTGYFYTTTRPRLAPYKLALRKYDPVGTPPTVWW